MSLLNTGDIVRCIKNNIYERMLTVGKEYTVVEHRHEYRLVIIGDDGVEFGFYPERFELVAAAMPTPSAVPVAPTPATPTFVRYNGNGRRCTVGRWYEVLSIDAAGYYRIEADDGRIMTKSPSAFDDKYYGFDCPADGWSHYCNAIVGHTGDILITDDLVDATAYAFNAATNIGAARPEPANPELEDLKQHRYTPETF